MTAPTKTSASRDRSRLVRRAWWAVAWFGIGLLLYLSLMPNPPSLDVAEGDKFQHIAAYATLMLWFAQMLPERGKRLRTAAALVGLGIALEFAQGATGYREFSVADMLANAIGVAVGWLLGPPRLPDLLALATRAAAHRRPPAGNQGVDS